MKRIKVGRCTLFKRDRSPYYTLRVMVKGRRRQFSTGEGTVGKATDKAATILADLKSRGLTEAVALHSRRANELPQDPTIEKFCDLYERVMAASEFPPAHQTQARYIKSLKLIAKGLRINRIRTLTPAKIKSFIADYQADASAEGRQQTSIKTSLNSILRNSAALFSKAALAGYKEQGTDFSNPFVGLKLRRIEIKGYSPMKPDILQAIWKNAVSLRDGDPAAKAALIEPGDLPRTTCPVCGGPMPKKRPTGPAPKYCSGKCLNGARWLGAPDWSQPHPAPYLILLLELGLGLRRHESDKAQKDWFFTDAQGKIYLEIKETPYFAPKSRERRVVPVAKVLHEAIKPYLREDSPFVVPGRIPKLYPPGQQPKNLVYRCEEHHRTLARWLRQQGVEDCKPCHVLRKQFGSYVATTFGLYQAQKFLGHSSPKVTSDYYAGLVELPEINHSQIEAPKAHK